MKNVWLIQTSGFNGSHIESSMKSLNKLGIEFKDFGILPEKKISNLNNVLEDNTQYIVIGGISMLEILNNSTSLKECSIYLDSDKDKPEYMDELKRSVDYDVDTFDQNNYKNLQLPLLNIHAEYFLCSDVLDKSFSNDMFIKPSKDLKAFNGGIIPAGSTVSEYIHSGHWRKGFEEETILIAPTINIFSEYRFFIVDGKVVTGSLYKRGRDVLYSSEIPQYILDKANEYANIYQPSDIFVMDLAETENGIKIIEYNCWNSSGFYNSDLDKLFYTIDEFKKK